MRKYIIGVLFGIALTLGVSAHAEVVSLVGRAIEGTFPVKISGKQLDQGAIVIDGTSYLPVRAIGEALNMDVSFNADLGIELKKKEVAPTVTEQPFTQTTPQAIQLTPEQKAKKLQGIDNSIKSNNENIIMQQNLLIDLKKMNLTNAAIETEKAIQRIKDTIVDFEKQKAELLK